MGQAKENTKIFKEISDNQAYMKSRVGVGTSFDVEYRELIILKRKTQMYYVNGLVDDPTVVEIIKVLVGLNDHETNKSQLYDIIKNRIVNLSVKSVQYMDEALDQMLTDIIVIFIEIV